VLQLLAGKASVDQLARRFGVRPETVEGWRETALTAVEDAFRQGSAKSPRESELERERTTLEKVVTRLTMKNELMERALRDRPSQPGKSRR
jgi:transposase-like protein